MRKDFLKIAQEAKKIGLRVFVPKNAKHHWLYIESKDGYSVEVNIRLGVITIGSSYTPSKGNGSGERLADNLTTQELIKILKKPIEPLFWVKGAGKRYTITEKLDKCTFEYNELNPTEKWLKRKQFRKAD